MSNQFLTNHTSTTFLDKIRDNLRHCTSFDFSVSFIKKSGLVLLYKDIEAAVERGCKGRLTNPRKTENGNGTYLFYIHMENELPEYLQYDFGLAKE